MADNLDIFRKEFLLANTWAQRKDGVPLYLLDRLSTEELKIAEAEMIKSLSLNDTWPIIGLGHIKSVDSLRILYRLLNENSNGMKVIIAHSIFQICRDKKMKDIVLDETPRIKSQYEIIDVLYMLPDFNDPDIHKMLSDYCDSSEYIIAYNAARAIGKSTDEVVKKFRIENSSR